MDCRCQQGGKDKLRCLSIGCSSQEVKRGTQQEYALHSSAFVHDPRTLSGRTMRHRLHEYGVNVPPRVIGESTFVRHTLDSFITLLGPARLRSVMYTASLEMEGDPPVAPSQSERIKLEKISCHCDA